MAWDSEPNDDEQADSPSNLSWSNIDVDEDEDTDPPYYDLSKYKQPEQTESNNDTFSRQDVLADVPADTSKQDIDYSPQSGGSAETEFDKESPKDHDGRGDSATTFTPSEADSYDQGKWYRFSVLHERGWGKMNSRRTDVKRDADTICSQFGLTNGQRDRVLQLIESLDQNSIQQEAIVLAAVSLVANQDDRAIRREDEWSSVVEAYDVSTSSVWTARKRVREQL